jgi:hypothetical protein
MEIGKYSITTANGIHEVTGAKIGCFGIQFEDNFQMAITHFHTGKRFGNLFDATHLNKAISFIEAVNDLPVDWKHVDTAYSVREEVFALRDKHFPELLIHGV